LLTLFLSNYQKINFVGGIEETLSTLMSSDSSLSNPIRSHTKAFVAFDKGYVSGLTFDFCNMIESEQGGMPNPYFNL